MAFFKRIAAATLALAVLAQPALAADRVKIRAFMEITGFDEALKSLRVNARNAPMMLGLDTEDFGLSWTLLADDLFQADQLLEDGLDILENTLDENDLDHAAAFYASELGQRLVAAENESHFADDSMKNEEGMKLAVSLMEDGSDQPRLFMEMSEAVGSIDHSIAAYREVQVRFILTAQAAGLVDQGLTEEDLRAILALDDAETKASIQENTIPNAAYTYQGFDDAEIQAYLDALSTPEMQKVYELMNAIQYTIMADRYEQMAIRMAELHPSQDL